MNLWNRILYNLCDYFGIILREKALYIELCFYIKRKISFIRYTLHFEKGLGKSYTLLKLSIKYNIPLVVNTEKEKQKLINNKNKYMKLSGMPNIIIYDQVIQAKDKYDILLMDECLKTSEVDKIKECCNVVIGYTLINTSVIEED